MGSTRLPGKVLRDLGGRPMLVAVLSRLAECRTIDEVSVATTSSLADDVIENVCLAMSVSCTRGSEHDVLSRYVAAQRELNADMIVRITADCPLIDPEVVDRVVMRANGVDYASNTMQRTFPRGLDAEAFTAAALARIAELADSREEREHVTLAVHKNPASFTTSSCVDSENHSHLRWTVDTPQDLQMVRTVWRQMRISDRVPSYREVIAHLRRHPEVTAINSHIEQKQICA